jgi:hypothetical protein
MTDLSMTFISGATALLALSIVSLAALRGWGQWIALRRHELDRESGESARDEGSVTAASRIDLADLRERVRKLEAIAAGVDL